MTRIGTLYGIGVGPGDPDLITVKAVKVLGRVAVVFAASSTKNDYSLAQNIVQGHLAPETEVRQLPFPMTRNPEALKQAWEDNARQVLDVLNQGRDAAFITLGDPMTYSTFGYLVRTLAALKPDLPVETVPGITAYSAAAARVNMPLAEGRESLVVVSGVDEPEQIGSLLEYADNAVVLKVYNGFDRLCRQLEDLKLDGRAVLASQLGLDDECIIQDPCRDQGRKVPYLSLMIIKKPDTEADGVDAVHG